LQAGGPKAPFTGLYDKYVFTAAAQRPLASDGFDLTVLVERGTHGDELLNFLFHAGVGTRQCQPFQRRLVAVDVPTVKIRADLRGQQAARLKAVGKHLAGFKALDAFHRRGRRIRGCLLR